MKTILFCLIMSMTAFAADDRKPVMSNPAAIHTAEHPVKGQAKRCREAKSGKFMKCAKAK